MNKTPKIVILLSTFNGADYLAEQLDSLLKQTYTNFIIIIRDDGSTDDTKHIIKKYVEKNEGKIYGLCGSFDNVGPSASFCLLIQHVLKEKSSLGLSRAYIMLCDQDDIWVDTKIEIQITEMLSIEQATKNQPVLIHTDLSVIDAQEKLISDSFINYQGLEIDRNRFTHLVLSNLVTGCTSLFNEELALKALPIPEKAIMHDWWLALIASAFGRVVFLDLPLVRYRQHGNNTIGAKEFKKHHLSSNKFWQVVFAQKKSDHLVEVAHQAFEFKARFGRLLSFQKKLCLWLSSMMKLQNGLSQRIFYRLARLF